MSLTFKLFSLGIRTLAKPLGNNIKRQAQEREWFRRFAINQAQRVHRIDMRMRLGILHDPDAQKRMHDREQKAADEKKRKAEAPTVRSKEEQEQHEKQQEHEEREQKDGTAKSKKEERVGKIKIRPLSDARAIELGANFFSEAFIFLTAVGLILLENWRSRYKESARRDDVAERISDLEAQVVKLRGEHNLPELQALNERLKESEAKRAWYNPMRWIPGAGQEQTEEAKETAMVRDKVEEATTSPEKPPAPAPASEKGGQSPPPPPPPKDVPSPRATGGAPK